MSDKVIINLNNVNLYETRFLFKVTNIRVLEQATFS